RRHEASPLRCRRGGHGAGVPAAATRHAPHRHDRRAVQRNPRPPDAGCEKACTRRRCDSHRPQQTRNLAPTHAIDQSGAVETSWGWMREIVVDTETTGLDPADHRIVEIGCVELFNHIATGKEFHAYINPERDMPAEAEQVHGLTEEFLADKPLF